MKRLFYNIVKITLVFTMAVTMVTGCTTQDGSSAEPVETNINTDAALTETVEEDQVLFDEMGIKIILNQLIYNEDYGKGMVLSFENNTEKDLRFDCKAMIINGFLMIEDTFIEGLSAGETTDSTIYFDSAELQEYGIDKIGQVDLQFDFYTPETYDNYLTPDLISFKTSEYNDMAALDFDSEVLYDDNDIIIKAKYVTESDIYQNVLVVYIENNTDTELMMVCRNVRINETDTGKYVLANVLSKKAILTHLILTEDDLKAFAIDKVEDIGFAFEIYDRNDLSLIDNTEEMTASVQ